MTQTDIDAAKPIRPRKHRMMRRAEAERRRREHIQAAGLAEIELGLLPFWRYHRRMDLEDAIVHHRDRAALYGEFLGLAAPGANNADTGAAEPHTLDGLVGSSESEGGSHV